MKEVSNVSQIKEVRSNQQLLADEKAQHPAENQPGGLGQRPLVTIAEDSKFLVVDRWTDPHADPALYGYYEAESGDRLTNFTMPLVLEEQRVDGDVETFYVFKIFSGDEEKGLRVRVADFNNDAKLITAIEDVCGARARIYCKPRQLREPIREHMGFLRYTRNQVSADFGWDETRQIYRFPSGSITRDGYRRVSDGDMRIELSYSRFTSRLDLKAPPSDLSTWKQHIWRDLVEVHDRRVTLSLLGAAGAAVLFPFVEGFNRFALWLAGPSGTGKSFITQLFENLFGYYPPGLGFVPTWNSTTASLQEQGHYFKDCLYLIDDFKIELIDSMDDVIKLVQNYADGTGRGRLKGGGMAAARPIRGLLVSTGELVPDHSASTLARTIVVRMPERPKEIERGKACLERCRDYSGVLSAFLHHILLTEETKKFAARASSWQGHFHSGIESAPNALRVSGNMAVLAASLEVWAEFLGADVPEAGDVIANFLVNDLLVLRDEMLALIRGTGAQPTYLAMLNQLIREERSDGKGLVYIGNRVVGRRLSQETIAIAIPWSMEEVNRVMTNRGWPTIEGTQRQLVETLRDDGVLCDEAGRVIPKEAHVEAKPVWITPERQARSFYVRSEALRLA